MYQLSECYIYSLPYFYLLPFKSGQTSCRNGKRQRCMLGFAAVNLLAEQWFCLWITGHFIWSKYASTGLLLKLGLNSERTRFFFFFFHEKMKTKSWKRQVCFSYWNEFQVVKDSCYLNKLLNYLWLSYLVIKWYYFHLFISFTVARLNSQILVQH